MKYVGIEPNDQSYTLTEITNAFNPLSIEVRCQNFGDRQGYFLKEIITCVDLQGNFTLCGSGDSCPSDEKSIKFLSLKDA